jgi:hypothetical protein
MIGSSQIGALFQICVLFVYAQTFKKGLERVNQQKLQHAVLSTEVPKNLDNLGIALTGPRGGTVQN